MDTQTPDRAFADLMRTMSKGQYLLLCEAIRQLGGEIYVDVRDFSKSLQKAPPQLAVSFDGEGVALRIK